MPKHRHRPSRRSLSRPGPLVQWLAIAATVSGPLLTWYLQTRCAPRSRSGSGLRARGRDVRASRATACGPVNGYVDQSGRMRRERALVEQLALERQLQSEVLRRARDQAEAKNHRRRGQMVMVAVVALGVGFVIVGVLAGGWPGRVATAVGVAAAIVSAVSDGRTMLVWPRRRR